MSRIRNRPASSVCLQTYDEYVKARDELDALNRQIDEAPDTAKPVFQGIVELHSAVRQYEREHKLQ